MPIRHLRVLVTGSTGFVGSHLCRHLLGRGYLVRAVGRQTEFPFSHPSLEYFQVGDIDGNTDWGQLLQDVDVVVHLASRVHQLKDRGMQHLSQYQAVNVQGTQQLAKAAIKNDVKRFVYVSTIKVIGEKTIGMPLRAENQPRPQDAYSLSKLQAEQILQEEARRSGMEWVIIRPPLVYGPHVKGNFRRLLELTHGRLPLPLASIRNQRSLVSIYNLSSFVERCLTHPHARSEVFLVSDNEDLSTPQLIRIMRRVLNRRSWMLPFPVSLLKLLGSLTGRRSTVDRLVESLQVNIEKSMRLLDWQPPFSVETSIEALYRAEGSLKESQPRHPVAAKNRLFCLK